MGDVWFAYIYQSSPKESLNIHIAPVQKVDIAKTIGGSKNNNIIKNILPASSFQIGGIETDFSEKEPTQLINSDELNIFYENSYKCYFAYHDKQLLVIKCSQNVHKVWEKSKYEK